MRLYSFALYAEKEDRFGLLSSSQMCDDEQDAIEKAQKLCREVLPKSEGYSRHYVIVRVIPSWKFQPILDEHLKLSVSTLL